MKYLDEFRDSVLARRLLDEIHRTVTRPWVIMEVCGGQTHSLIRYGIDRLLPDQVELVHGPGCPVCVTPATAIDRAIEIARLPNVILCTFGDMLRVPGSRTDLMRCKASGGDVRVVYSPLDAVRIAQKNRSRDVVMFGIGFETTAPANAMSVQLASQLNLTNFSLLASHVRVPPVLVALLTTPANRVQGFLAAGHVCSIMGVEEYEPIASRFRVPIVVTGFEPLDLLDGIRRTVTQLEVDEARVENAYERVVREQGNTVARQVVDRHFEVVDQEWRGLGSIPSSGMRLRNEYRSFDAWYRFANGPDALMPIASTVVESGESSIFQCRSGDVLRGILRPTACPAFGTTCTPEHPLGATMVSAEGACAAYFHAGRLCEIDHGR